MRYSIMLQLVLSTTVVLLAAAALFAWLQNRPRVERTEQQPVKEIVYGAESVSIST
jgi:hypothetical protein